MKFFCFALLITVQLLCNTNLLNAQKEASPDTKIEEDTRLEIMEIDLVIDSSNFVSTLHGFFSSKEINKGIVKFSFDSITRTFNLQLDTTDKSVDDVRQKLLMNGIVISLKKPEIKSNQKALKYKPEIDLFLNLEDSTIFESNFQDIALEAIHPSRKDRYLLIQILHEIGVALDDAEQDLGKDKVALLSQKAEISISAAEKALLDSAKENVSKAQELLSELGPLAKEISILSEEQKAYYKSLKDQLNLLYKKTDS